MLRGVSAVPEGLSYLPGFVTATEEAALLDRFATWTFDEVRLHGQAARRTARHFGVHYDVAGRRVGPAPAVPDELIPLRERAAAAVGLPADAMAEVLVLRYPPGAGIGWHRDAPQFGAPIVGVSLGAECPLRFQHRAGGVRRVHEQLLERRSAYVLDGPARWAWQHHIARAEDVRYSVTFRTLRAAPSG
jgi:alkylated DNA repair dioxygenase AlkB